MDGNLHGPNRLRSQPHGHLHHSLPRLQGVVRRRAGDPGAAARRRAHGIEHGGRRCRDQHVLRHERSRLEVAAGRRASSQEPQTRLCDRVRRQSPDTGIRRICRTTSTSSHAAARRSPRRSPAMSARSGVFRRDHRLDRVRAFVKIQDGCSFSCAFCVIPLVRGGTRSRSAEAVLTEIGRRVAQGHREVVLTGVNLGCFRDRAAGLTLTGLIRAAGEIDGLERLRLSSIEVNHVTPDLIAALRETPIVSRHLHVPLQSGDDQRAPRDGAPLHDRAVPRADRAARRLQPHHRRDRRLPERGRARVREHAQRRRRRSASPRCTSFRTRRVRARRTATDDPVAPEVKKERGARLRARVRDGLPGALGKPRRQRRRRPRRPPGPSATPTTTRRGSSMRRSAPWCGHEPLASRMKG